jgi:hypothetical protein
VVVVFFVLFCYGTNPILAFLVLVRIHCDFNKFHFSFFKKKKKDKNMSFYKSFHYVPMSIGLCDIDLVNIFLMLRFGSSCKRKTEPNHAVE